MKALLVIITVIASWMVFAVRSEILEQRNAYTAAKVRDNDTIHASLRKMRYCLTYDMRTIKWRRSLMSSGIVTLLLFLLLWQRLPSSSEFLTHILVVTIVFSAMWTNFSKRTGFEAASYADANLDHVKKLLQRHHSFILPNWF